MYNPIFILWLNFEVSKGMNLVFYLISSHIHFGILTCFHTLQLSLPPLKLSKWYLFFLCAFLKNQQVIYFFYKYQSMFFSSVESWINSWFNHRSCINNFFLLIRFINVYMFITIWHFSNLLEFLNDFGKTLPIVSYVCYHHIPKYKNKISIQ